MDIQHVHFYVENAGKWQAWLIERMGFLPVATARSPETWTEIVRCGGVWLVVSSARTSASPVAAYLEHHPPGVADLAFGVSSVAAVMGQAIAAGATIVQPVDQEDLLTGTLRWGAIAGWQDLRHTLLEWTGQSAVPIWALLPDLETLDFWEPGAVSPHCAGFFDQIDHAVLNVAAGDLERVTAWYERVLGLQRQQVFTIQTQHSGLCSRVLGHPSGTVQLPINEPASPNSQIQEFLDLNRGAGIQHVALRTRDALGAIANLRQRGVEFLAVPPEYYTQLRQRDGFSLSEESWQAIAQQQVLVDWDADEPNAMLLQAFTQPIFPQPTFFFEVIERRAYWSNQQQRLPDGFGEGNFQALFQAMEQEQRKRGSLGSDGVME
ncbi:MAG: 4-hydroxyphenylpyruvate dioxygenase [Cyanobacteria bacterium J069]|nr:MAG: 4-hydroxyphenylpyruvate dioxygenase [Cyanobacteria bacterium J069]